MLLTRFTALAVSIVVLLVSGYYLPAVWAIPLFVVAAGLTALGFYDLAQPLHSVRRNYPIIGHLRWFFEEIRPEIRQYLIEDDEAKVPFSRAQRSLVYARAKNESSDRAFGTLVDVYENGYEFIAHSTRRAPAADPATFRVPIGGDDCEQPYSASIFNISAMSFGSLSANAILALNKGAKLGGFAHDTGEGSISPYHREHGGDLIWETLVEDFLSLVPAAVFLIASRFEKKAPTRSFPFGYQRLHSLAALIAAVALVGIGAFLLFDSASTLIKQEHPTIAPVSLFGREVWLGWLMIATLAYSVVPPVILGRIKQPVARRLQDEVLDTDAMMQKADWLTGLACIAGIVGVGFGLWWADALAAGLISFSILKDGITSVRVATAELIDGTLRALGKDEIADDAWKLIRSLESRYPGASVRLRETGRYIHAEVIGAVPEPDFDLNAAWPGDPERRWRLVQVSFVPQDGTRMPFRQEPQASESS